MHEKSPSGIGLSGDLNSHLRQVYRKTFERLDREGRIDEAVFVPAELRRSGTIIGFAEDVNWQALVLQEPDGRLQQWREALAGSRLHWSSDNKKSETRRIA